MEIVWTTRECGIGQRTIVHCGVNQRVKQNVGYTNKVVDSFPSTNRWTNRVNESRIRTVSLIFHRP